MKDKELEVELFMGCASVDILCIMEHWLKNFQLSFDFTDHRVASFCNREGSIHEALFDAFAGRVLFYIGKIRFLLEDTSRPRKGLRDSRGATRLAPALGTEKYIFPRQGSKRRSYRRAAGGRRRRFNN
ncbi:hypothetical protein EVAR_52208_1 [Eumeta japonica]|uniref:Uncharacterized protein n=1 Tax=Eumeta variegata TaxID=151549 RepID=A0A4C1Z5X0_EUMVA|nr:hypothetical protein EVAR_52208_1 [Eumeta japonica]